MLDECWSDGWEGTPALGPVGIPPEGPVGMVDADGPEGGIEGDGVTVGRLLGALLLVDVSAAGRLGGAAPQDAISGRG